MKKVKVQLWLDLETLDFLRQVKELSGASLDDIIGVILAIDIVLDRRDNPKPKKKRRKRRK